MAYNNNRCLDQFGIGNKIILELGDEPEDDDEVRRTISTYGCRPVGCYSDTVYIVTGTGVSIPHRKGAIQENNNDQYIFVEPEILSEDEKVFWFINISKMTICQYEDAGTIRNIKNITIL